MDNRFKKIFEEQEKEDEYRITKGLEMAINEELGNSEHLLKQIKIQRLHRIADAFDFSIQENIVRISAEFSIRKHSTCLIPYYHSHDFYEMIYVWQGESVQKIASEAEDLKLSEGDSCILTPGMVHAMLPCTETDVILKIIIPNPMMKQLINMLEEGSGKDEEVSLPRILECKNRIYSFYNKPDSAFGVKKIIGGLLYETYLERSFRMSAINSLFVLLLIILGRSTREQTDESILQRVSDYIQNNIRDANLEELAKQLGYSNRQLRRKILESSGGTFSDILWKIRIEEAAKILNETDIPVEEIAKSVGYHSTAGFYKRFWNVFRMTPAAYRKMYDYQRK